MDVVAYFRERLAETGHTSAKQRAVIQAAIDATEQFERDPANTSLNPLLAAAVSPLKITAEFGNSLLIHLAERHPVAQSAILRMARAKQVAARHHAVSALGPKLPEHLRREVIQLALSDRAAKVRIAGVQRVIQFTFTDLLPRLEELSRTETDPDVLATLADYIPLLRDGYRLDQMSDGEGYGLTVPVPQGGLVTMYYHKDEMAEISIAAEVERIRNL